MRYLSVCSGIEAATVAWHPLGWTPAAFSEIEKFPRAVLAHHYPAVPLHGDFTTIGADDYGSVDVLVGGTPCQDFSLAGLRAGITGSRGNLTLEFLRLAARQKPRWIVWENVPGVLSSDDGRALGSFLGGLGQIGYGFAYRVLDAQFFGLAQRRARVFVVAHLGNWRRAAAVLFERESLRRDTPPRRQAGEEIAGAIGACSFNGGAGGRVEGAAQGHFRVAGTLQAGRKAAGSATLQDAESGLLVAAYGGNNTSGPVEVSTSLQAHSGPMGRLDFASETFIAHAFDARQSDVIQYGDKTGPLDTDGYTMAVAFDMRGREGGAQFERPHYTANMRAASGGSSRSYIASTAVRRLTPRECERLQGFPDDYTLIPLPLKGRQTRARWAADGPRYKALGNSMAVPVMHWIGRRIALVEAMT